MLDFLYSILNCKIPPAASFVHKASPVGAYLILALFIALFLTPAEKQALTAQVATIDQELVELEEMKRGFEGRALRHENQAERLQFIDRDMLEARRHWQLADENRAKAGAVQAQIDTLLKQKEMLLQQLGTQST